MTSEKPTCQLCGQTMTFVRDVPFEIRECDSRVIEVPLASDICKCPIHGEVRVYINGRQDVVR